MKVYLSSEELLLYLCPFQYCICASQCILLPKAVFVVREVKPNTYYGLERMRYTGRTCPLTLFTAVLAVDAVRTKSIANIPVVESWAKSVLVDKIPVWLETP